MGKIATIFWPKIPEKRRFEQKTINNFEKKLSKNRVFLWNLTKKITWKLPEKNPTFSCPPKFFKNFFKKKSKKFSKKIFVPFPFPVQTAPPVPPGTGPAGASGALSPPLPWRWLCCRLYCSNYSSSKPPEGAPRARQGPMPTMFQTPVGQPFLWTENLLNLDLKKGNFWTKFQPKME